MYRVSSKHVYHISKHFTPVNNQGYPIRFLGQQSGDTKILLRQLKTSKWVHGYFWYLLWDDCYFLLAICDFSSVSCYMLLPIWLEATLETLRRWATSKTGRDLQITTKFPLGIKSKFLDWRFQMTIRNQEYSLILLGGSVGDTKNIGYS